MKAEQRKELETNTLANKMGQVMTRVKSGQRRTFLVYVILGVAVAVGLFLVYRWYNIDKQDASLAWVRFDDGSAGHLEELIKAEPPTQASKAAQFQRAWIDYWEFGVKRLGADPAGAMDGLRAAGIRYRKLLEDCKDDPLWEPEAMLGIAVVEESKAVQDRGALEQAVKAYEEIVSKHKATAAGKFAEGRLEQLKDKTSRAKVADVYGELQKMLKVPPLERAPLGNLPFDHPPIFGDDKKK